ncbi:MAG: DUF1456 family protein [Bacteroidetes bacterium]|nr:DUF1456 family protein [Bacteroidota bacterium]
MTNNDILRRLRYTFNLNDKKVIALFGLAGQSVTRAEISDWLKKENDTTFQRCNDRLLATFLNGLIIDRRGQREGTQPQPENHLTNNIILRKLKIALDMKDEDIIDILSLTSLSVSKHELSALFRKRKHKNYRPCKDQILRNFLLGLQLKYRDKMEPVQGFKWPQ